MSTRASAGAAGESWSTRIATSRAPPSACWACVDVLAGDGGRVAPAHGFEAGEVGAGALGGGQGGPSLGLGLLGIGLGGGDLGPGGGYFSAGLIALGRERRGIDGEQGGAGADPGAFLCGDDLDGPGHGRGQVELFALDIAREVAFFLGAAEKPPDDGSRDDQ